MGSAEEDARQSLVDTLMKGSQSSRDKFIITTLLDLKENGCAQKCSPGAWERWTPAAVVTAVMGGIIGALEYLRSLKV